MNACTDEYYAEPEPESFKDRIAVAALQDVVILITEMMLFTKYGLPAGHNRDLTTTSRIDISGFTFEEILQGLEGAF